MFDWQVQNEAKNKEINETHHYGESLRHCVFRFLNQANCYLRDKPNSFILNCRCFSMQN